MLGKSDSRRRINLHRLVLWFIILVLFFWNLSQIDVFLSPRRDVAPDFAGYWSAARIFMQGGNPYDAASVLPLQRSAGRSDQRALIMWSPPWCLLFVVPFALLPFSLARSAWLALHVLLLVIAADWFWVNHRSQRNLRHVAWITAIVFMPSAMALNVGQIIPIVLVGLSGFLWALGRNKDFLAGMMLVLMTTKLHVVYLFPVFLLLWMYSKRRWGVLEGTVLALFGAAILGWIINPQIYANYFHALGSGSGPGIWETPTIGTALRKIFHGRGVWMQFVPTVIGFSIAIWLWRTWCDSFDWSRRLITILLLSVITTAYCWTFDLVVLLPAVLAILSWFAADPGRAWACFAGLVGTQVLMMVQLLVAESYFVLIWVPPALALLYWFGSLRFQAANPSLPAEDAQTESGEVGD